MERHLDSRMFQKTICFLLCVVMASCQTTQRYSGSNRAEYSKLERGVSILVTTIDSQSIDMKFVEIRKDALVGDKQQVPLKNIKFVEVKKTSAPKTAGLTVAIIAGVIVVGMILLRVAFSQAWSE